MKGRNFTHKQYQYANYIMNEDMTRGEAMIRAGYSEKASEHPARVEQSEGFVTAMTAIAGSTGKAFIKFINEVERRDLSQEDTKVILQGIDTLSRAWERFVPKKKDVENNSLSGIFDNVIDITSSNEQPKTLDL